MAPITFLSRSRPLITPLHLTSISNHLHHQQYWTNTATNPNSNGKTSDSHPIGRIPISLGFLRLNSPDQIQSLSRSLDATALASQFTDWMASNRWADVKQLFESWIRCLDSATAKPNKPDVDICNQYLRANFMMGASPGELLDLVAGMDGYGVLPDTASLNVVLKGMLRDGETRAAEKLIERMLQTGKEYKESLPDDESYDLIIGGFLSVNQIDSALKYIDLMLKSGYMLSTNAVVNCVQTCINSGRLQTLVSIIERCKKMDKNKALFPPWCTCNYIADVATQSDNCELTFYSLEFMAKWIAREEIATPAVLLSVDEGLVVSALGTAGRTRNAKLLDGSWAVLKRSLRQKMAPSPESYLGKIYAYANLGNLQKAFGTLHEFEAAHGNSIQEDGEGLFSPFYSLNPLVMACATNGLTTLDAVYYQLQSLSQADHPYKSVAALNCIILGCANIWDMDRAYQTFNAIDATFGLTPNTHSYNALICAFGKLGKTDEAIKVFEHFTGLGMKPNMTTYSLLVNAHLIMRDPKAALSVIDEMTVAGYEPSKEMLKKVRRRCIREMDYESDDKVESLARRFKISMGTEVRRDLLFDLQYSTDYS